MPIWLREKTVVAKAISTAPASWRIPFGSVEPLVCVLDCVIIVGSSILSGVAYHRWMLGGGGEFETSLAVGLLVAVNFTTILVSRGSYKPLNLISLQGRIKETAAIWFIVFSLLLAVVFSLKVGANLSRGATATFMVVGCALMATLSTRPKGRGATSSQPRASALVAAIWSAPSASRQCRRVGAIAPAPG